MRIRVIWEGKTKDSRLRAVAEDFAARIAHFTNFAIEELPTPRSKELTKQRAATERLMLERSEGNVRVLLDPAGEEWTSIQLARWIEKQAASGTREISFVIGGPDGFSDAFRKRGDALLALSRMTFAHDFARALLLEQIYRSFTILRGYPYSR